MIFTMYEKPRVFHTQTLLDESSCQCTKVDNQWYTRFSICFCGGAVDAIRYMNEYKPKVDNYIVEINRNTKSVTVLIPVNVKPFHPIELIK